MGNNVLRIIKIWGAARSIIRNLPVENSKVLIVTNCRGLIYQTLLHQGRDACLSADKNHALTVNIGKARTKYIDYT